MTRNWILSAYAGGLRLLPRDYRTRFAAQMLSTFEASWHACRPGRINATVFVAAEWRSLMAAIALEWIEKWHANPARRGSLMPDVQLMRPPGVRREDWFRYL